jgi:hypothetical protein
LRAELAGEPEQAKGHLPEAIRDVPGVPFGAPKRARRRSFRHKPPDKSSGARQTYQRGRNRSRKRLLMALACDARLFDGFSDDRFVQRRGRRYQ